MKIKRALSITLSLALAAALMALVLIRVRPSDAAGYLKELNYMWIILAIALYTLDMLARAYRWREILKGSGVHIKLFDSFLAYNLGNTMNIIIPAKIGDAARSYYVKKKLGHGYSKTLPGTFLDRLFDVLGVYVVILVSSAYVVGRVSMPGWFSSLILFGIICLCLAFLGVGFITRDEGRIERIKSEKIRGLLISLSGAFKGSMGSRAMFLKLFSCSVFIWMCDGLFTYMIFLSMGQSVNPMVAIFANMTATLTKIFPVTPGGIGVFEGTMVLLFSLFGFDPSMVGILSTLDHFLMNMYTMAIGALALIKGGIRISNIREGKVN